MTHHPAGFELPSVTTARRRRCKLASPFGFFVLPRSDLPLVLEENVQSQIGQPPVWKERARL